MKTNARALPTAVSDALIALYNAGKWSELVIAADGVASRYPGHGLGWQASGKAFLQLGRLPEAIDKLSRFVEVSPGEADGYNDLGNALYDAGRVDEALANYRHAVTLNPRLSEPHSNLGRILCGLGRFEEAAECCQRAIDITPGVAIAHNNLGNALGELGRLSEAEASYRRSLALKPDYLDALINLGSILADLGRWDEAKASYRSALKLHPNSGVACSALGRLLSRLCEDDEEAQSCLERAVAMNVSDVNTYAELGNVLMRGNQTADALAMFRRAQELQPLITWPANQEKAEFSVVFLDTPMGGSTPVNYLAGRARYDRHFQCVIPDMRVDIELLRSKADLVFNMISNADDARETLVLALQLAERLGSPTINHPRLIMNSDRESIARRIAHIPYTVVPRTARLSGLALARSVAHGNVADFGLPLLVRVAGPHGGDDFFKFDNWPDVGEFVSKKPAMNYYLIEYIEYRSDDDFYRKYRVIFIDGEILPYHLAIHDDWKVHHFRTDMANHAWMRDEEKRFLEDIGDVFDAPHRDALKAIAKATELDYGGIDFGLDHNGQIVVFEANASMLVHDEKNQEFAYKNHYVAKIKDAFDAMLSRRRLSG